MLKKQLKILLFVSRFPKTTTYSFFFFFLKNNKNVLKLFSVTYNSVLLITLFNSTLWVSCNSPFTILETANNYFPLKP